MERNSIFTLIFAILTLITCVRSQNESESIAEKQGERDEKLFNVFTIVRFPNDPCQGSSNRNGTCYTESECTNKGGANAGSCAQGFGVCCVFVATCGASVAENCTYFQSSGGETGACSLEICPCSSGICQMRLDFFQMMITGPSTSTTTVGKSTAGVITPNNGIAYTLQTMCLTDTFTVTGPGTGPNTPPTICGTNNGEHMYAEFEGDECNSLDFQLGTNAIDATLPTNRGWNIKITQIECDSDIRAPQGCTQYFYGSDSQQVRSYNFNAGQGLHLANQNQNICVRKERGNCKICWTTVIAADFDTNNKNDGNTGKLGGSTTNAGQCCAYGKDGMGTAGYDCVVIPGAAEGTMCNDFSANGLNAERFCGNEQGLAIVKSAKAAAMTGTICTKTEPFNLQFLTDAFEAQIESAIADPATAQAGSGFQLTYFMTSNNC